MIESSSLMETGIRLPIETAENREARAHLDRGEVTRLLRLWRSGDDDALNQLFPVVYEELRRLAGYHLRQESADPVLQATALVHDVYLRLVKDAGRDWAGRTHFFAVSSRIIRHLLVGHARGVNAQKRGSVAEHGPLDAALDVAALVRVDIVTGGEAIQG